MKGEPLPAISVVIPTLNRAESLRAALESFAAQSLGRASYEVIVVNDGSTDETPDVCRGFHAELQMQFIEHRENLGIAAAKNSAIAAARGSIIVFADDDDIAGPHLLEEYLKAHREHPGEEVAILGYTTWSPDIHVTPLMRYVTDVGRFLFAYGDLQDKQLLDFSYFWGGRSSCKRSFLGKYGLFDPTFRTILEDVELGYRLSKHGLRVVFYRAAVSYMTRSMTWKEFADRSERQGAALYRLSQLYSDPVMQNYCRIGNPFIESQFLETDPLSHWPEVAAAFYSKVQQLGRVEPLLRWGFDPELSGQGVPESKEAAQAEAYQSHIHELFVTLQATASEVSMLERKIDDLERKHDAEVALLHQVRELAEQRHVAEFESEQERHKLCATELQHLQERLRQTNEILRTQSIAVAELEERTAELLERLRKQLWATKRLMRLLDDAENAAKRLRASRRWKLSNPIGTLRARLSDGKISGGYGHLEKVVTEYSEWRSAHPEAAGIKEELEKLSLPFAAARHDASSERSASLPPVPSLPVESIHFPRHDEPDISIVIPVFNKCEYTHACLASLLTVKEAARFEVIVVDDGSSDHTAELFSQVPGVTYLRNDTNSGFTTSCNRGAERARGKYIVFLNNDTTVTDHWLTILLNTFAEEPKAGVVGSKLIYPDMRLQEAGCITWRDGSAWNYGKFDDPRKPEYNYMREVDYCSAAAFMIPKALFDSVAGFDPAYSPAYYEDTDLCFKVRSKGFRVLYQPCSEVIHYEGITGGTDVSAGAKKYQEINRATFIARWADELVHRPSSGDLAFLAQPSPGKKSILVIDHHLPMPDRDSGSLRMFQILRLLHELGHRVVFIPDNLADVPPYTGKLQQRGIEVHHYPYTKSVREYLAKHGNDFDIVVLSRCEFARKHISDVRLFAPQARIIFDTVDLHFLREAREAKLTGNSQVYGQAEERRRIEYELIDQVDETWVVSPAEQQLLTEERPNSCIEVVSNIVDIPGSSTPFGARQDLLFIGSFLHTPNIDAVLYFVDSIYPHVAAQLPDAKFFVIGDKAPPEIIALASKTIVITGPQSDVRPFFESVKLSVAPLRYGAGIKGKINQSLAFAVPVVATSVAVEGMDLVSGEDVLVADDPQRFAHAIVDLYRSEQLWNRLSQNGLHKARTLYSVEAARKKLDLLLNDDRFARTTAASSTVVSHGLAAATGT